MNAKETRILMMKNTDVLVKTIRKQIYKQIYNSAKQGFCRCEYDTRFVSSNTIDQIMRLLKTDGYCVDLNGPRLYINW